MNVKEFIILILYCFSNQIQVPFSQTAYGLPIEIVANKDCDLKDHSYYVSLQEKMEGHFCGGSLISAVWVLTSASCCTRVKKETLEVFSGLISASPRFNSRNSTIKDIVSHPKYNKETHLNDICLLELTKPIFQNKLITYARLHVRNRENNEDTKCKTGVVVGYGIGKNPESTTEEFLHCANTLYLNKTMCQLLSSKSESSFCTQPNDDTKSCFKRDGGPYLCNGVQYGIIAGKRHACGAGYPDINTEVGKYERFIEKTINHEKSQTSYSFCKSKLPLIIIGLYYMY